MNIWHKQNPSRLEAVDQSIMTHFPTLHVVVEHDVVFIRGALHLPLLNDYYSIEIELLDDYPESLPLVRETAGRIPHIADRHICADGTCCLFVAEETSKYYSRETTIQEFIDNIVTAHFINQKYYEAEKKWLWGDRRHGIEGILDFYREKLQTNDKVVIFRFMQYLAKPFFKDYYICFCGSKKQLKNCHLQKLKEFRKKIKPHIVRNSLIFIAAYLEKTRNSAH